MCDHRRRIRNGPRDSAPHGEKGILRDPLRPYSQQLGYLTGADIICDGGCIASGAGAFSR